MQARSLTWLICSAGMPNCCAIAARCSGVMVDSI